MLLKEIQQKEDNFSHCHLDDNDLYCKSCYKTLGEIAHWNEYTDEYKNDVLERIEARKNRDTTKVPKGVYCYEPIFYDKETGSLKIKLCPFWGCHPNKEQQDNGFCILTNTVDWGEDGYGLL